MSVLWVFLGGALGGVLRYLLAVWLPARTPGRLSPGLFAANLLGSLLLGSVAGFAVDAGYLLLGTGLCGSLTTFSTFAIECVRAWRAGHRLAAVIQAAAMLGSGVAAAAAGLWLGGLPG
ncbi:fluoride efflux transporter FluC [Enemella sp. A6]|uniref:fluoride efflux transporter FluC n=1 Tax=Enemella sp. A6 TaxID=3440152 RepID=UPI003EB95BA6